jgi:hypothetical protein
MYPAPLNPAAEMIWDERLFLMKRARWRRIAHLF